MPNDNYRPAPNAGWGECSGCKYWPALLQKSSMKACIFDNTGDIVYESMFRRYDFYDTSLQLAKYWRKQGNRAEVHLRRGSHCEITRNAYAATVSCLDDGTGTLVVNSESFTVDNSNEIKLSATEMLAAGEDFVED